MTSLVMQLAGAALTFVGAFVAAWPGLASKKADAERALVHPIHAAAVVHDALLAQRAYAIAGVALAAAGLAITLAGTVL